MKRFYSIITLFVGWLSFGQAYALPPMQLFVDITPAGGVLKLPPGVYGGPVVINKKITLDGQGEVTIDGEGEGTVVTLMADGIVLKGLHITNSGESHNQVDSGIHIKANNTRVENNVLDNVLFGIHIQQARGSIVRGNQVTSKPNEPSLRGEGLRMWYSQENLIEENEFFRVRDMLVTNSSNNRFLNNRIEEGRIGIEFVFSPKNVVLGNIISGNSTGFVVLYSGDLTFRGNRVIHIRNSTGSGFSIKDSPMVKLDKNEIIHCAYGLIANAPLYPENILYLDDNLFAYNDIAMYFYGEKGGHVIHGNRFENNMLEVLVSAASSALANDWQGNYWDQYQGFDMNRDGVGDRPHRVYIFADRIWMDRPMTRFFRRSPVLEVIDFAERLAPFSEPVMILEDPAPRMH
ncbi:MAG: nitrous oxide reductase family maturation protein NosD [Gammaproteobacteria bacterium]|nr:nitrous oxide reductase family maturation protein NosD [Gammaproteobacteria bacterium]